MYGSLFVLDFFNIITGIIPVTQTLSDLGLGKRVRRNTKKPKLNLVSKSKKPFFSEKLSPSYGEKWIRPSRYHRIRPEKITLYVGMCRRVRVVHVNVRIFTRGPTVCTCARYVVFIRINIDPTTYTSRKYVPFALPAEHYYYHITDPPIV